MSSSPSTTEDPPYRGSRYSSNLSWLKVLPLVALEVRRVGTTSDASSLDRGESDHLQYGYLVAPRFEPTTLQKQLRPRDLDRDRLTIAVAAYFLRLDKSYNGICRVELSLMLFLEKKHDLHEMKRIEVESG
ncbi:hypothetical protein TNCV_1088131 [Trichonephila clavipes]|uniref:Uncharacterized protein n=1 Tax=Trichonephila clavipes TaxID=2585209 RepID=A0A8X6SX19_TRICX|nr:hypothetical protein TNCV_1088131 [Trichonephila clavipes]